MGMDVYGKNPKLNKTIDEFPVMKKYDAMQFAEKWKILDKNEKDREQYWTEKDNFEDTNVGQYFRNNCWWWRPLWNYCYIIADDIISEDVFNSGHSNNGAGLGSRDSKKLGNRLMECIADGSTIKYQAEYIQWQDDLPDNDCMRCNDNNRGNKKKKDCKNCNQTGKTKNFDSHYPFDVDNVERFARFCLESGGFEIC